MTAGTIDRCDLREHGTVTPAYTRTDLVVAGEVDTQDAASPPWKTKSESQYAMLTGVLRDIQRTPKILHDDQYTTAHRSKTDIRVLHVLDRPHGTAMFREGVDCVTIEISVDSQQAVQHVPIPYDDTYTSVVWIIHGRRRTHSMMTQESHQSGLRPLRRTHASPTSKRIAMIVP